MAFDSNSQAIFDKVIQDLDAEGYFDRLRKRQGETYRILNPSSTILGNSKHIKDSSSKK